MIQAEHFFSKSHFFIGGKAYAVSSAKTAMHRCTSLCKHKELLLIAGLIVGKRQNTENDKMELLIIKLICGRHWSCYWIIWPKQWVFFSVFYTTGGPVLLKLERKKTDFLFCSLYGAVKVKTKTKTRRSFVFVFVDYEYVLISHLSSLRRMKNLNA